MVLLAMAELNEEKKRDNIIRSIVEALNIFYKGEC